ncbi:diguanylate cyclase (GGDEF)-like protein [Archangium gephyra]|uniref:diguanylate cyclase n=1 Tax=Archangium gephyra TaxID=48 RepID=A0ABX9JRM9_9BACT|nr:GGDEF domain-containing protein [Archangium gephyra]REG25169.1 diguanylate cyclase (GGDEF)-like protein [Archangium gephyra]
MADLVSEKSNTQDILEAQALTKQELNTRVVRSLALYFESHFGRAALEELLSQTGLSRSYLEDDHNWVSAAYLRHLLKTMAEHARDPRFAFKAGCYTSTREAIGVMYNVLASFSRPRFLYRVMFGLTPHYNKVGRFTVLDLTEVSLTCIYQPLGDEYWDEGLGSEFRLGQLVSCPRICGLPDAEYKQKIIEVDGRPAFHYTFEWKNPPTSLLPLYGAVTGLLSGLFIAWWSPALLQPAMVGSTTLVGLLTGWLRMSSRHIDQRTESLMQGLSKTDEALQVRYNDLSQQNLQILALNAELSHKVCDIEKASRELQELNSTLQQRVDEQTRTLKERNHQLEQMAKTDVLTGLGNRRSLEELSREAFKSARAKGTPLGCIMIDIDHFKRFNTEHGHAGGDIVLREVGRLLQKQVKEAGVAARYGGEEFAILLPGNNLKQSVQLAETLMAAVRSQRFDSVHQFRITLSMGVASFPESYVDGHEALFRLADEALYRAKTTRDSIAVERPS